MSNKNKVNRKHIKYLYILTILLSISLIFSLSLPREKIYSSSTVQNYYSESTAESTTTSTTYQDKTTLTFTPDANSTYLIMSSWLNQMSSTSYYSYTKLTRTSGTAKDFNELIYRPKDATDYIAGGAIGIDTFTTSPTSQTYKIQYRSTNASGTARIKQAMIFAIKLNDNVDKYAQAETRTTTTSTTYVDKTTLTFTPDTAGEYIIFASATLDGSSTSIDSKATLNIDGTLYSTINIETNNATNKYPWFVVKKVNLTSASHTIKIQYASETTSNTTGIAHARIVALRADRFLNNYYAENETRATTTSTSYQNYVTLTQTPQAGDHLIIGVEDLDGSSTSSTTYGQLVENSTSYGEMLRETKDSSSRGFQYISLSKESLTETSTSWYLQYKTKAASNTAGINNGRLLILELKEPSITTGSTGSQISEVAPNTSNVYIGGAITLVSEKSTIAVTSITVNQTGTISDYNIGGLTIYYKQESTCSSSIPVDATKFNTNSPISFSSGASTVTGSISVGTSQICLYLEVDINSGNDGDTIELGITNPSTQIVTNFGTVLPSSAVTISGTTTLRISNTAPNFTAFSNNGPINLGSIITFSSTASDPDGDNITLVVCKTQGVSGTACDGGSGDTWCTSSSVTSNPSCQYTIPSVFSDGNYNSYPYIFDSKGLGSSSGRQGSLSTFTVNNVSPVVSSVTINSGNPITLQAGTTKATTLTATVSDNNGCSTSEITSVKGYAYRSSILYAGCDTAGEANDNYCYPEISCSQVAGSCTGDSDASADYTCTANIYYFADPTDTNTKYPSDTWFSTIKATDNNSATSNTTVSTGVEMNSLIAFSVTTAIDYGTLAVGQSNNPLDKVTTITPTGNVGLDSELSGAANMCTDFPTCSGYKIAISNQKYALAASTSYSSAQTLPSSPLEIELNIPKPTTISPASKNIWWGILIPSGTQPGIYNGLITITAVKGETAEW